MALRHEVVDRQELDGRHAEPHQVLEHCGVGEAAVGAALVGRHGGMEGGQALDVRLVDDRVGPGHVRSIGAVPLEVRRGDEAVGHDAGAVAAGLEELVTPADGAVERGGVGIDEQLGRVCRMGAADPVAVAVARADTGDVGRPDVPVAAQFDAALRRRVLAA